MSLKTRHLTNRGFMRGPFLPLYGSGAIMMLVVSMPFQNSMPLTYLAGCVGATLLEYVTGVVMEALFKVRYWDYSNQKFNFQGHICLTSTLAWGGLTILMTEVIHKPVEQFILSIPMQVLSAVTFLLTAWIFADFALSFRAALDLRDVLIKLEDVKIELGHLQMRMDFVIALTGEELEKKVQEYKDGLKQRRENISGTITEKKDDLAQTIAEKKDDLAQTIAEFLQEIGSTAEQMEHGLLKEKLQERISSRQQEMARRRRETSEGMEKRFRKIFRANPTIHSASYREELEELQRNLESDLDNNRHL